MSTATVDQASALETTSNSNSEVPIVEEKKTYARVIFTKNVKQEDGEVKAIHSAKVMSEKDADETLAEFQKNIEEGKPNEYDGVTIEIKQTFGFDHAHTLEAATEVFGGNTTELLKQLNNSIDVKLGNRVRSLLLATEEDGAFSFYPDEATPTVSLRKYIGEESATRGKTDFQKTVALAGKLPPEQKAALLALLAQS